jgi:hypothetical protein
MLSMDMSLTAFFTVAESRHFLGVVALLNSLRLVGHTEELVVLDCGLTQDQSRRLAGHATVRTTEHSESPFLLKWLAPLDHPAEVKVLLDADLILTRSMESVLTAADGKFVAFEDPVSDRFHPAWQRLLKLGTIRRSAYFNAGIMVLPRRGSVELLRDVQRAQESLGSARTRWSGGSVDDPFHYPDQDVWNAIVAARAPADEVLILDGHLAPHPPFAGIRVDDERSLRCSYPDGREPVALHHVGVKPWLAATRSNVYSTLFPRVLTGSDVRFQLSESELPNRFRQGFASRLDRERAELVAISRAQRGRLGIRRRLRSGSSRR